MTVRRAHQVLCCHPTAEWLRQGFRRLVNCIFLRPSARSLDSLAERTLAKLSIFTFASPTY
jgi:hypothetical protein